MMSAGTKPPGRRVRHGRGAASLDLPSRPFRRTGISAWPAWTRRRSPTRKSPRPPSCPWIHAHAHNDDTTNVRFFEALENGFCSVEADVFLVDGKLLVGHTVSSLRPERTLESLYLDPLRERAKANGGKIYPGGPTIFLLIDVKTSAKETCAAGAQGLDG